MANSDYQFTGSFDFSDAAKAADSLKALNDELDRLVKTSSKKISMISLDAMNKHVADAAYTIRSQWAPTSTHAAIGNMQQRLHRVNQRTNAPFSPFVPKDPNALQSAREPIKEKEHLNNAQRWNLWNERSEDRARRKAYLNYRSAWDAAGGTVEGDIEDDMELRRVLYRRGHGYYANPLGPKDWSNWRYAPKGLKGNTYMRGGAAGLVAGLAQPAATPQSFLGTNTALGLLGGGLSLRGLASPIGAVLPGILSGGLGGAIGGFVLGGPIGAAMGGISGALVGGITSAVKTAGKLVSAALGGIVSLTKTAFQVLGGVIKGVWDGLWKTIKGIGDGLRGIVQSLLGIVSLSKLIDLGQTAYQFSTQGNDYTHPMNMWRGYAAQEKMNLRQVGLNAGIGEWAATDAAEALGRERSLFLQLGEFSSPTQKALLGILGDTVLSDESKSDYDIFKELTQKMGEQFLAMTPLQRRDAEALLNSGGYSAVVALVNQAARTGWTGGDIFSHLGAGTIGMTDTLDSFLAGVAMSRSNALEGRDVMTSTLSGKLWQGFGLPVTNWMTKAGWQLMDGDMSGAWDSTKQLGSTLFGNITGAYNRTTGGFSPLEWLHNFIYGMPKHGPEQHPFFSGMEWTPTLGTTLNTDLSYRYPNRDGTIGYNSRWMQLLNTSIPETMTSMRKHFLSTLKDIQSEFPNFWFMFKYSAKTLWDALATDGSTVWSELKASAKVVWDELAPDLQSAWDRARFFLTDLMDTLVMWLRDPSSIDSGMSAMMTNIGERLKEAGGIFAAPIQYIKELMSNLWNYLSGFSFKLEGDLINGYRLAMTTPEQNEWSKRADIALNNYQESTVDPRLKLKPLVSTVWNSLTMNTAGNWNATTQKLFERVYGFNPSSVGSGWNEEVQAFDNMLNQGWSNQPAAISTFAGVNSLISVMMGKGQNEYANRVSSAMRVLQDLNSQAGSPLTEQEITAAITSMMTQRSTVTGIDAAFGSIINELFGKTDFISQVAPNRYGEALKGTLRLEVSIDNQGRATITGRDLQGNKVLQQTDTSGRSYLDMVLGTR